MIPTAVASSFFPEQTRIGDLALRPFSMAQYMFLGFMRSPMLTDAPMRQIDAARSLVVMTRPIATTMQLWQSAEPAKFLPPGMFPPVDEEAPTPSAAFDEEAWTLAESLSVHDLVTLGEKIKQHIDAEFAKAVPMRAPDGKEGNRPKESADTQKVSAGN
jgi:hypothetical protein